MQYRPLGQSGIPASTVAFGAWALGGWNWGPQDDAESIRSLHAAIDAGMNLIDTAPIYGFGRSEEIVGKAIADRRDRVLVATKCGMRWDLQKGRFFFRSNDDEISEDGDKAVYIYTGPDGVREEVERSLKRMNIETIDLLQTHWQDEITPIADTMAEFLKLKDEGKIRAIGTCNASIAQLNEYRAAGPFDTDQEKYSLLDRGAEAEKLPYCQANNIAFLAYSPLANGLLTGKIGPDRVFAAGDMRAIRPRFAVESRRMVMEFLEQISPIAADHKITLSQLVIAWTLAQPGMTHALVGARTEAQAIENAAAADVKLSDTEIMAISTATGDLGDRIGPSAPVKRGKA